MLLYSKIVLTSQEPSLKNVLWANPDTNELKYWNGAMWESFFTKKGGEFKQDKYDNKLLTNRKDVVGAINENVESIQKVGERISNIDLSFVAKEATLIKESQILQEGISFVEDKIQEVKNDIANIDLTPIENKVDESVNTLSTKIDNIDLSAVAKEETLETQGTKIDRILDIMDEKYANEINEILGV